MAPRLLDLFCGPGGASVGYARAGWDVTGVDIQNQPDYPYEFHKGDALEYLQAYGDRFDAVHASPPCAEHTTLTGRRGDDPTGTYDLLGRTLQILRARRDGMWVVENVMGADMQTDVVLCGAMFGLRVYRHRRFAIGHGLAMISLPWHPPHKVPSARAQRQAAWDAGWNMVVTGSAAGGIRHQPKFRQAMGIDWMTHGGINLAIPPAYTELLGEQLLEAL